MCPKRNCYFGKKQRKLALIQESMKTRASLYGWDSSAERNSRDPLTFQSLCSPVVIPNSQLQMPALKKEVFQDGAQQTTLLSICKACLHTEEPYQGWEDQSQGREKCSINHGGLRETFVDNFIHPHMH